MNKIITWVGLCVLLFVGIGTLSAQNAYDTPPVFAQGKVTLTSFIELYCVYPEKAATDKTEGTVILNAQISNKGDNEKFTVKQSVSPELDAEALRVAHLFPDWTPALKDKKPVACVREIPFVFQLSHNGKTTDIGAQKTPLYVVNGNVVKGSLNIDPNTITSIRVKKGAPAVKQYGEEAKDGVVIITTK